MSEVKVELITSTSIGLSIERYNKLIEIEKESLRQRDFAIADLLYHFMRFCQHDIGCRGGWGLPKECSCGLQAVLDDSLYAHFLDQMVMKWCKRHRGAMFVMPDVEWCPALKLSAGSNKHSEICNGRLFDKPVL